jgi:hypothetical protein
VTSTATTTTSPRTFTDSPMTWTVNATKPLAGGGSDNKTIQFDHRYADPQRAASKKAAELSAAGFSAAVFRTWWPDYAGAWGIKQRLFDFASGSGQATVTCRHCLWTSAGRIRHRTSVQDVFDRSNDHECPGVESHAEMLARTEHDR